MKKAADPYGSTALCIFGGDGQNQGSNQKINENKGLFSAHKANEPQTPPRYEPQLNKPCPKHLQLTYVHCTGSKRKYQTQPFFEFLLFVRNRRQQTTESRVIDRLESTQRRRRDFPTAVIQQNPCFSSWTATKLPLATSPYRPVAAIQRALFTRLLPLLIQPFRFFAFGALFSLSHLY